MLALRSRLYAILDLDFTAARGRSPIDLTAAWLTAGVRLFQLRAKAIGGGRFLELAAAMAAEARGAGATFIVNDRVDVARLSGADGVHVGQTDLAPADVRLIAGADFIVGRSTHNDAQVRAALDEPATYLAIGPVFATRSKANADPVVGLDGVAQAAASMQGSGRPLVAIGGITLAEAPKVIEAGADAVAVIADLLEGDPEARAREFLNALA